MESVKICSAPLFKSLCCSVEAQDPLGIYQRFNKISWCGCGGLTCEYLRKFPKKFEMTIMLFAGTWGKMISDKPRGKKSRDTVPLTK